MYAKIREGANRSRQLRYASRMRVLLLRLDCPGADFHHEHEAIMSSAKDDKTTPDLDQRVKGMFEAFSRASTVTLSVKQQEEKCQTGGSVMVGKMSSKNLGFTTIHKCQPKLDDSL